MKKISALVILLLTLNLAFAIDGAMGLGNSRSKVELDYTGGGLGLAYDMGFSDDFTASGKITSAAGVTGFGAGLKYAFLNERKGNDFSFAGKLDLMVGGGYFYPVPGLVISKKRGRNTLLAEASGFSIWGASFLWLGFGGVIDLDNNMQVAAEIGTSNVYSDRYHSGGFGFGLGLNWLL